MFRIQLIGILVILLETRGHFGQSLARKKSVTMSSQHGSWVGSNAVDGNYMRECGERCCAATNAQTRGVDPWIKIDLGETNTFTRIVLYSQTTIIIGKQSLNGLTLYLDNKLVASINTTEAIYDFYHFELSRPYSARHIKFVLGGDKVLVLCEVDVYNDSIISKDKITSSSSTYLDWVSSLAVDGLISTNSPDKCHCCAGTVSETDPWLTVDLGDIFLVTSIQLYGRTDAEYGGLSFEGMTIQLDDTDIESIPNSQFIQYYELFPVPEKIGRHVKFIFVGSKKALVMCEVVIYGERVISIGKEISQSTQFKNWKASRAVDGNYQTEPRQCHCCSSTIYQKDPYLRLNLGNVHRVTRIAIYSRTDGNHLTQNLNGVLIEFTTHLRTILTQESDQWINFFTFQLSPIVNVSEITLTHPGANNLLVVCELLVYGECSDGYFGEGCSRQCRCEGLTCHTITGICPSRMCMPGYRKQTCNEPCELSLYGKNCSEPCGHCKGDQTCNHITGHCSECAEGYYSTDQLCKTVCSSGTYGRNCTHTCGKCRNNETCNTVDGYCSGCLDGYTETDLTCTTLCSSGTYGRNCTHTCGKCRNNETCNTVDGYCSGCLDGYAETTDLTCKTQCQPGHFGFNCENRCGMCRCGDVCDIYTGVCPNGCSDGYKDGQCLQAVGHEVSCNSYSYICLPVFMGSLGAVIMVYTTAFIAYMFHRKRQNRNADITTNSGDPPITLPNTSSDYETLQLNAIGEASMYEALNGNP